MSLICLPRSVLLPSFIALAVSLCLSANTISLQQPSMMNTSSLTTSNWPTAPYEYEVLPMMFTITDYLPSPSYHILGRATFYIRWLKTLVPEGGDPSDRLKAYTEFAPNEKRQRIKLIINSAVMHLGRITRVQAMELLTGQVKQIDKFQQSGGEMANVEMANSRGTTVETFELHWV